MSCRRINDGPQGSTASCGDHSDPLREGVCETLVILSVHGNNLFREFGFDAEARVAGVIRRLLTPLTLEKLMSHERDLPRYAEAAPEEFLKIIETDLASPEPVVLGLLKPAPSGHVRQLSARLGFSGRSSVWRGIRRTLPRVSAILRSALESPDQRQLGEQADRQPVRDLQRANPADRRLTLRSERGRLEMLTRRYPDIGWQICIEQFGQGGGIGGFSYRPHWRSDASGAGKAADNGKEDLRIRPVCARSGAGVGTPQR